MPPRAPSKAPARPCDLAQRPDAPDGHNIGHNQPSNWSKSAHFLSTTTHKFGKHRRRLGQIRPTSAHIGKSKSSSSKVGRNQAKISQTLRKLGQHRRTTSVCRPNVGGDQPKLIDPPTLAHIGPSVANMGTNSVSIEKTRRTWLRSAHTTSVEVGRVRLVFDGGRPNNSPPTLAPTWSTSAQL